MSGASKPIAIGWRAFLVALVLSCLGLAFTDGARADTYCVAPSPEQLPGCAQHASIQAALDAAKSRSGGDRVLIGEGRFTDGPFCYMSNDPLEIVGDGPIRTVLMMTGPAAACDQNVPSAVLTLSNLGERNTRTPPHLRIRGVEIRIPAVADQAGLVLEGGFADDVQVTSEPNAMHPTGVVAQGLDAGFTSGSVTLPRDASVGLRTTALFTLIARSEIHAVTGVLSRGKRFSSQNDVGYSNVTIHSSVITIADANPGPDAPLAGLWVFGIEGAPEHPVPQCPLVPDPGHVLALARNLTVYGSSRDGDTGVALVSEPGASGTVVVASTVADNVGLSLVRNAAAEAGTTCLLVAFSSIPFAATDVGPGAVQSVNLIQGPPGFVNASTGDFHLRSDSPLIDTGDRGTTPFDPPVDFDGTPRVLDGHIDTGDLACERRRDIGAFEFDPGTLLARASGPPEAVTGHPVEFDASTSCDPNVAAVLSYRWSFDDGATTTGARVLHTFATPGRHEGNVVVTSSDGRSGTARVNVTVSAAPKDGGGTGQQSVASRGNPNPKPRARRLDIRPRAFRAAGAGASIARSIGAFVRYRLSEQAEVQFTVQRTKRRGRNFDRVGGSFGHKGRKDSNKFRFTGRLAGKKLRPGRYRLVGVPTDAARNRGQPVRVTFRITKR